MHNLFVEKGLVTNKPRNPMKPAPLKTTNLKTCKGKINKWMERGTEREREGESDTQRRSAYQTGQFCLLPSHEGL